MGEAPKGFLPALLTDFSRSCRATSKAPRTLAPMSGKVTVSMEIWGGR